MQRTHGLAPAPEAGCSSYNRPYRGLTCAAALNWRILELIWLEAPANLAVA